MSDFETDPFGEAASIIRKACQEALIYEGAMNETEYQLILYILNSVGG